MCMEIFTVRYLSHDRDVYGDIHDTRHFIFPNNLVVDHRETGMRASTFIELRLNPFISNLNTETICWKHEVNIPAFPIQIHEFILIT